MLRVSLLGNLGADPEVRYSQKGAVITAFRVAVNQVRTGPDGERQENTEWFRVRVSGPRGEFAQRLTKGQRVLVIGRLDISHYTSREGEARVGYDVWADEVQSMTPRSPETFDPEAGGAEPALAGVSSLGGSAGERRTANGRGRADQPAEPVGNDDLEDLPF